MKRRLAIVIGLALTAGLLITPTQAHHRPWHKPKPTATPTATPSPTATPLPTGQVIATFSPGVTAAQLASALANNAVDVIELTPGTYSPGTVSSSANRTRPILLHPQTPGTVTFDGNGSDVPFALGWSGRAANMTFDDLIFTDYLIGERGLFTLGNTLNITMNHITIRNTNGTRPTYSWALYLSSSGGFGPANTRADYWTIEGVAGKTLSGFHSEHDPNARTGTFNHWVVNNVPFAIYIASDATMLTFDDWDISNSGSPHDDGFYSVVFVWASGGLRDICLTNSGGFYVYPAQPFVDQRACLTP